MKRTGERREEREGGKGERPCAGERDKKTKRRREEGEMVDTVRPPFPTLSG